MFAANISAPASLAAAGALLRRLETKRAVHRCAKRTQTPTELSVCSPIIATISRQANTFLLGPLQRRKPTRALRL